MPSPQRWPDALLAGFASSMRTFAGPGMLALRGRITGKPRAVVLALAAGEMAVDKSPAATHRTDPPALGGRIVAGAYTGNEIAGPAGVAAGAVGAGVGTFATWRARSLFVKATGLPDPVAAVAEDIIAATAAAVATRPDPEPEPERVGEAPAEAPARPSVLRSAAEGLAAGVAGTALMSIAQGAEFVLTDAKPSDAPFQVAQKLNRRAGRGRIKRKYKEPVNQGMHWALGSSWGIPYGVITAGTRVAPEVSGPVLGLFAWAAALAHQPALGVAEVPWKRSVQSLGSEALFHVVYGVGAGAALRAMRR